MLSRVGEGLHGKYTYPGVGFDLGAEAGRAGIDGFAVRLKRYGEREKHGSRGAGKEASSMYQSLKLLKCLGRAVRVRALQKNIHTSN